MKRERKRERERETERDRERQRERAREKDTYIYVSRVTHMNSLYHMLMGHVYTRQIQTQIPVCCGVLQCVAVCCSVLR